MNRSSRFRIIAAATLAISLGIGLVGCSGGGSTSNSSSCKPSKGKVTLTYWGWLTNGKAIVEEFNKTHKNIQVKYNAIGNGTTAYQDYLNALKAGTQPDLANIEYSRLPNFLALNDLTNVAGCASIKNLKDSVVPWAYNQVTVNSNKLYAGPLDTAPVALYYRPDIFQKYGLTVPKTWSDYMADAEKLKAENPAIAMTTFGPQDGEGVLTALMWQAGSQPYAYKNGKFVIDMHDAAAQKVANYWQQMIDKKLVNTTIEPLTPALYKAWSDGTVATTIGPTWIQLIMGANAASASGKWAVAELPQWQAGQHASGNDGGSTTAILKGTKHPYEAAVFADWMTTNPDAWKVIYQGKGTSASLGYAKSGVLDTPQPYYNNQKTLLVFQKMSEGTNENFSWSPDQGNLNGYIDDSLSGAFNGSSTILKGLEDAQAKAVSDLKGQSIPVVSK